LEAAFSEREVRRMRLQSAAFFEGLKRDQPGRVRTAMLFRTSLTAHKIGKLYVETGLTPGGAATDAESVAVAAADAKAPTKRARHVVARQSDQMSVRYALLAQTLQAAGIPATDDEVERAFVKDGPNAVSAMMNDINSVIDRKRRKLADTGDNGDNGDTGHEMSS
jgi:hypothetical protein